MSVKIRLDPYLQWRFTGSREEVEVEGQTVSECLSHLVTQFPKIKQQLWDEQGKLFDFCAIFVNSESLGPEELTKPLKDGDRLDIILARGAG